MTHQDPDGKIHPFRENSVSRNDIEYVKTRPNCVSMWVSPNIEGKKSMSMYISAAKMFERPSIQLMDTIYYGNLN